MGASSSKKPDLIQVIKKDAVDLEDKIKTGRISVEHKKDLHQMVVTNSKILDSLRPKKSKRKKSEVDKIQKLLSNVSEELIEYNDNALDSRAETSASFIQLKPEEEKKYLTTSSTNSLKKIQKKNPILILNEIEDKLREVKKEINTGIVNEDNKLLKIQKRKIEMLQTDIELADIDNNSLSERKLAIERDLLKYYQRITKRQKQVKNTLERQPEINQNEQENKVSLNSIETYLQEKEEYLRITKFNNTNLKKEFKNDLNSAKKQLESIKTNEKEVQKHKTVLIKKIASLLRQVEEVYREQSQNEECAILDNFFQFRDRLDDINTQIQNATDDEYDSLKNTLTMLKEEVKQATTKHSDIEQHRKTILEDIDTSFKNLQPLEKQIEKQIHDSVVLRQKMSYSKSLNDLVVFNNQWDSLEKRLSSTKMDELIKMDTLLANIEQSIHEKRKVLNKYVKSTPNVKVLFDNTSNMQNPCIKTNAKVYELPQVQLNPSLNKSNSRLSQSQGNVSAVSPSKFMDQKRKNRHSSVEIVLNEITNIADRVDELGIQIGSFKGTYEDLEYNFYKSALKDKKDSLNRIYCDPYNQIADYKKNILSKIHYFDEYLKCKLKQNEKEKLIRDKIKTQEAKVNRFSGTFKNIHYNTIEGDLNSILKEIDSTVLDDIVKKTLTGSVLKHLKILKEKSNYDKIAPEESVIDYQKARRSITETGMKILKINKEVGDIRNKIDSTNNRTECEALNKLLQVQYNETYKLSPSESEIYEEEIKLIIQNIEDSRRLIEIKLNKRKSCEEQSSIATLLDLETQIKKLKVQIDGFLGTETDEAFKIYDKKLDALHNILKSVNVDKEEFLYEKRQELLRLVNFLMSYLDKISLDSEALNTIENNIKTLMEEIENFEPTPENAEKYNILDETLINYRIDLEKLSVVKQLQNKKVTCLNYIEHCIRTLNEAHTNSRLVSKSIVV